MPAEPDTLFSISGPGITPYSARGLTQTLIPIEASKQIGRTINGVLVDLSDTQFRKYHSTVQCSDQRVPAFDGVFPGDQLTVDCIVELAYKTSGGSPTRAVVSGSSRVEGSYTFYRPQLTMLVISYSVDVNEWGATVSWTLELEEV